MTEVAKKTYDSVIVHTGNIVNMNEVKMKAGQNTTEELIESLKHVIHSWRATADEERSDRLEANKVADYRALKLNSYDERKDVKVTVKIFVRQYDRDIIRTALTAGFNSLNTSYIDSVVLALRADDPLPFNTIQNAWTVLEEFGRSKQIFSIGVSDIETEVFIALYEWAKVKPGIVQINLANCCVVPPTLQSFAREHEVQLLTHSDPIDILPDSDLAAAITGLEHPLATYMANQHLLWAVRYQIHIKCRGVLSSKGYIIHLTN